MAAHLAALETLPLVRVRVSVSRLERVVHRPDVVTRAATLSTIAGADVENLEPAALIPVPASERKPLAARALDAGQAGHETGRR